MSLHSGGAMSELLDEVKLTARVITRPLLSAYRSFSLHCLTLIRPIWHMPESRLLPFCLLLASCSDDLSSPSAAPIDDANDASGATVADASDASVPDASPMIGTVPDASTNSLSPPRTAQCKPGRYEGMFNCSIGGLLPWTGSIAFELVKDEMGAGEFRTLSIAAGTKISSDQDSMGGTFSGQLAASFDCQTGLLSGDLVDGKYLFLGSVEYHFKGPLTGSYRMDGGAPGFDGKLGTLTSIDFEAVGAFSPTGDCTWSADLADDKPDAGP
jgi:hypothetical protein